MKINKQIMQSKNKGLFYSLIQEINKQPFKLVFKINYLNGLRFKGYVLNKSWFDVYLNGGLE